MNSAKIVKFQLFEIHVGDEYTTLYYLRYGEEGEKKRVKIWLTPFKEKKDGGIEVDITAQTERVYRELKQLLKDKFERILLWGEIYDAFEKVFTPNQIL